MSEIQEAYGSAMLDRQSSFKSEPECRVDYTVADPQPLLAHGLGGILQSAKANVLVRVRKYIEYPADCITDGLIRTESAS